MENVFLILINLLISAAVYLGIALLLILTGKRKKSNNDKNGLIFNELLFDYANLPQLKMFAARDGKQLGYRHYTAQSDFFKYDAPTMRANSGGWAHVHFWRIAGLTMLNNVGIHGLDYLTTLEFNMPEEARDGTETLAYSHRLNTAYAPRNYKKDLRAITEPLLVVVGSSDYSNLISVVIP